MNKFITGSNRKLDHVLRIKKLTGHNIIKRASMHNLREIPSEIISGSKINGARTCHNQILIGGGSSSEIKGEYEQLIEAAKLHKKIRKDAVMGIEVIVSLPSDHTIDELSFFCNCIEWCKRYFGVPLLSAVIHRDEANPHIHILLVPLVNGRLQGSQLVGNRSKWRAMQEHFYEHVAGHYGFTKPRPMVRYPSEFRRGLAAQIVHSLRENVDYLRDENVQIELIEVVSSDPLDLAGMVGVRV